MKQITEVTTARGTTYAVGLETPYNLHGIQKTVKSISFTEENICRVETDGETIFLSDVVEWRFENWELDADRLHELLTFDAPHSVDEAYQFETSEDYKMFDQMAKIDPDDLRGQLLG